MGPLSFITFVILAARRIRIGCRTLWTCSLGLYLLWERKVSWRDFLSLHFFENTAMVGELSMMMLRCSNNADTICLSSKRVVPDVLVV